MPIMLSMQHSALLAMRRQDVGGRFRIARRGLPVEMLSWAPFMVVLAFSIANVVPSGEIVLLTGAVAVIGEIAGLFLRRLRRGRERDLAA
ncbi:MAG: hypothetical protein D6754_00770 [Alphaproteobacteria bacterium]|nr:MAG: hypothetical protein D6754_00770 [Alphaproteobacteria bacterium]